MKIGQQVRATHDINYFMGQIESDMIEKGEIVKIDRMTEDETGLFFIQHADRYGPFESDYFEELDFQISISDVFKEIDVTINRPLDYNLSVQVQQELDRQFEISDSIADYEITYIVEK